jgi:hypothetical protein
MSQTRAETRSTIVSPGPIIKEGTMETLRNRAVVIGGSTGGLRSSTRPTASSSYASASWSGRWRRGESQSYRQPEETLPTATSHTRWTSCGRSARMGARRLRLGRVIPRARREAPALRVSNDAIGVRGVSRSAGRPGRVSAPSFATQDPERYGGWLQGSYKVGRGVDQGAVPKLRS